MLYFVCIAKPASTPAPATGQSRRWSQPQINAATDAVPRASAGTSSMKLKRTKSAGDRTITIEPVTVWPGAKRATSQAVARQSSHENGNSQSLSKNKCSPNTAIPTASQYGSTGGIRISIAGWGTAFQNSNQP